MTETEPKTAQDHRGRARRQRRLWGLVFVVVIIGGSGGAWYAADRSSPQRHGAPSTPGHATIDSRGDVTGLPDIDRAVAPILEGHGLLPSGARLSGGPCQRSSPVVANCGGSFYSANAARELTVLARTVSGSLPAERSAFPRNALPNYGDGKGFKAISGLGDKAFIRPFTAAADPDQAPGENKSYDTFWTRHVLHGTQIAIMVRNVVIDLEWYAADIKPAADAAATPKITSFSDMRTQQQATDLARAIVATFS